MPMPAVTSTAFFLGILVPLAIALSIDFPSFDQNSPSKFNFAIEGDVSWSNSPNGRIELTRNQRYADMASSAGRVIYKEPFLLWNDADNLTDFSTHFTFIIHHPTTERPADGMTFFLSPYPDDSSIPIYSTTGCGLGVFDGSLCVSSTPRNPTPIPIVAVEFDTFPNLAVDDPPVPHVGIDVGSAKSVANISWEDDGNEWQGDAWVSYDSGTSNLSVSLTVIYGSHTTNYNLSYIVDLRQVLNSSQVVVGFSASTGQNNETHALLSWNFSSTLMQTPLEQRRKGKTGLIVGGVAGVGTLLLLLLLLLGLKFLRSRKKRANIGDAKDQPLGSEDWDIPGRPNRFSYEEMAVATSNFSRDVKLGEGGFGSVYKGHLERLNRDVAIKRFAKESSKQGWKEFFSEVNVISRLGHRNLVQLFGWCHDQEELLLVYELLPNGSLDSYLHSAQNHLGWPERYKIALDLASVMLYLHHEWEQCVLHRDVKPSNIMLDSEFNAKLGDFGLARFIDHDLSWKTTEAAGTRGYMASEYLDTGKASKESDVYSFGVVALEIACGRRPSSGILVELAWELYAEGRAVEAADEKLNGEFDEEQMERLLVVGLWCAHPDFNLRPSMKQAINVLNGQMALPNLPPRELKDKTRFQR